MRAEGLCRVPLQGLVAVGVVGAIRFFETGSPRAMLLGGEAALTFPAALPTFHQLRMAA
jgi:hypothetical protein